MPISKYLFRLVFVIIMVLPGSTYSSHANCTTATFINNGPAAVTIKMAVDCSPTAVVFTLNAGQTIQVPANGCCILEARINGPGWNVTLTPGTTVPLPAPFTAANLTTCSIIVL